MSKIDFTIRKRRGNARVGELTLNGVTVTTPVFMPVGTKATIKGVPLEWMNSSFLGSENPINIILNNTFHLYLHPWADLIQKAWGLHTFQHWDRLILTDSGWFQVFSLWLSKSGKSLVKLSDNGVAFKSPYDGSSHVFTPTWVVDIQRMLWSDIMMMLDVCSPVLEISKDQVAAHMATTHKRAKEQYEYHQKEYDKYRGVLFPIIQGGLYPDLREQSAKYLTQFATDGIAIGWLSVGETREEMYQALVDLHPHLPENCPRYLMWVGTPEDLRAAIEHGIDMFDCVMPTRIGRHGSAFTANGVIKISNASYKEDFTPIEPTCKCHTCKNFTKAYLHHLHQQNEMMSATLLSLHNIAYLHATVESIKQEILAS